MLKRTHRQSDGQPVRFSLLGTDSASRARRGRLETSHGNVETPAFMPVGTQATVKTLDPREVEATGARIILANTYHLMLRPGVDVIRAAGQLHRFMAWDGPILTDSGGFQVFSLASQAKVSEEGVTFKSHIDGSAHQMTPEGVIDMQFAFGSDVMMPLDHVLGLPATRPSIEDATDRTHRWLERAVRHAEAVRPPDSHSALFGICQGGMEADLRRQSARFIASLPVAGCAIGGLSVGEPKPIMAAMLDEAIPELPAAKPRYLMGVGSPEDLWNAVAQGVDLFDCVLPTRTARNGGLFTPEGRVNIKQAIWRNHHQSIDPECDCATCARFTAAYLHHLFRAQEVLGLRLASVHNVRFLVRQMETMRRAIVDGTFIAAKGVFDCVYRPVESKAPR